MKSTFTIVKLRPLISTIHCFEAELQRSYFVNENECPGAVSCSLRLPTKWKQEIKRTVKFLELTEIAQLLKTGSQKKLASQNFMN